VTGSLRGETVWDARKTGGGGLGSNVSFLTVQDGEKWGREGGRGVQTRSGGEEGKQGGGGGDLSALLEVGKKVKG